jgi:hypothetical protein
MIMIRIRPKRQRNVGFEPLEGRLALSTGFATASPHLHAAIVRAAQHKVPASFKGQVSISGTELSTTNLTGHIGPDRFTGYGTGTVLGTQFQGGDVYLSNSNGTIHLALSPFFVRHAGRAKTRTFAITVVDATGKYAPFVDGTGTVTRWSVPARQNAHANVSGVFNL